MVWQLIFHRGRGINCSFTLRPARFDFDFVGLFVRGFRDPLSNVDLPFVLCKGVDSGTVRATDVARY